MRYPPWHVVSNRHICAITHFATYRATIKVFCDTIATSIAQYEKYRCWTSKRNTSGHTHVASSTQLVVVLNAVAKSPLMGGMKLVKRGKTPPSPPNSPRNSGTTKNMTPQLHHKDDTLALSETTHFVMSKSRQVCHELFTDNLKVSELCFRGLCFSSIIM